MMGYRAAGRFTWDAMALVRYPSRQALASMVKDPDYREKAGPLRALRSLRPCCSPSAWPRCRQRTSIRKSDAGAELPLTAEVV